MENKLKYYLIISYIQEKNTTNYNFFSTLKTEDEIINDFNNKIVKDKEKFITIIKLNKKQFDAIKTINKEN